MALKADRNHVDSLIDFFFTATAERGGIASVSTLGSGAAMDSSVQVAAYTARASGSRPLGVLMSDVVNLDLTRQKQNVNKEEVNVNQKVTIWSKGWVVTNRIVPGQTPAANQAAFVGPSGLFSNVLYEADNTGNSTSPVGVFLSQKDEEGYAKVSVNLP